MDNLKNINDKYGHLVGNDILKSFGEVIRSNLRHNIDVVGRYGGDEFLFILPESTSEQALIILERIRERLLKVQILPSFLAEERNFSLHFSAGVSSFPYNGDNLRELIDIADTALYHAKKSGGNKTVVEKRKWIRVRPLSRLKVEFVDISQKKRGQKFLEIANISQRGMLFLFSQSIRCGEILCRFYLPEEERAWEFKCRVVHKEKTSEGIYRVGVNFIDIPLEAEEKLSKYISFWK